TSPSLRCQPRNDFLILIVAGSHLDCRAARSWRGRGLPCFRRLTLCAEPVVAQPMALSGIHRCHQFESVKSFATCVHFLEYQANGFVRRVTAQSDDRDLIALECLQHLRVEAHENVHGSWITLRRTMRKVPQH